MNINGLDSDQYRSRQKLLITGDIVQLSQFAKSFGVGKRKLKPLRKNEPAETISEDSRKKAYARARRNLINTINTNVFQWFDPNGRPYPAVFLTLTFAENITDIETANYEFTLFIRRLSWEILHAKDSFLKYVTVIEFQKRGAIHYHVIFFNLPFVEKEKIGCLWKRGYIKISVIDNINDIGYYVTKYMAKDFDDPRLKGHKCYFVSRGLKKPVVVYFEEVINLVKPYLPKEALEGEKKNIRVPYLAFMDTQRYNLRNYPEAKQQVTELVNQYS